MRFRPRVTGAQQARPRSSSAAGTPSQAGDRPASGRARSRRHADRRHALEGRQSHFGGRPSVVHRPRSSTTRARPTRSPSRALSATADAVSSRPRAPRFGNPRSRPARKVKVEGVGSSFGGELRRLERHARLSAARSGYQTHFQISGRSDAHAARPDAPAGAPRLEPEPGGRRRDQQQRPRPDGAREGQVSRALTRQPRRARGRGSRRSSAGNAPRHVHAPAGRRGGHRRLRERRHAAARSCSARSSTARTSPATDLLQNKDGSFAAALQREGPHALQEGLRDQERPEAWSSRSRRTRTTKVAGQRRAGDRPAAVEAQGRHDLRDRGRAAR